jgi:hypothetical protein
MAIWEDGREEVTEIKRSPLWACMRELRVLTGEEWAALDPVSFKASHHVYYLIGGYKRREMDEELLQRLACCGTFDAIAALLSLQLEASAAGEKEYAFLCARYLPPAVAMLTPIYISRRVALLIFAYLRGRVLDKARWNRQVLDLTRYDIPLLQETAKLVPPLASEHPLFPRKSQDVSWPFARTGSSWELVVPSGRVDWVRSHLPPTRPVMGAGRRRIWRGALSPMLHPDSPCQPHFQPPFHAEALHRIRDALGKFA